MPTSQHAPTNDAALTGPRVYTFAVYPSDMGDAFDAFLVDVPTLGDANVAARRAWWTAFHWAGSRGIEPEAFTVCVWSTCDGTPGRLVTSGGLA